MAISSVDVIILIPKQLVEYVVHIVTCFMSCSLRQNVNR